MDKFIEMKNIIFEGVNHIDDALPKAGELLKEILGGTFSLDDWTYYIYQSVPGVHVHNSTNRIGKKRIEKWFSNFDLNNFQLFVKFNEQQWRATVRDGAVVESFVVSNDKLEITEPKGMRFFLTQNGILAWHASEVCGFFSNEGCLRRLCASDEFEKLAPHLQQFTPVKGDLYAEMAMTLGRLEPELTRAEYFDQFLRNEETAEGNLIEDYDVEKHQVLIRCQRENCDCVGYWWEDARFYFH